MPVGQLLPFRLLLWHYPINYFFNTLPGSYCNIVGKGFSPSVKTFYLHLALQNLTILQHWPKHLYSCLLKHTHSISENHTHGAVAGSFVINGHMTNSCNWPIEDLFAHFLHQP